MFADESEREREMMQLLRDWLAEERGANICAPESQFPLAVVFTGICRGRAEKAGASNGGHVISLFYYILNAARRRINI
jgi:hypothetical protein